MTAATVRATSRIAGTGSAFPSRGVDNSELCEIIARARRSLPDDGIENFGPEWIFERTGIVSRHFAGAGESLSSLATEAARIALSTAGLSPAELDGILLATCTPDQSIPASAALVHRDLGAGHAFAFDVNAACSGFHHAWSVAHAMIVSGQARNLLVIGADLLSRVTDYTDRKSAILFGDGAGAMVLSHAEIDSASLYPRFSLTATGADWDLFEIPAGGSSRPIYGELPNSLATLPYSETKMQMQGAEIFKTSVRAMIEQGNGLLSSMALTTADVDHVVPHQANLRILEMVAKKQRLSLERFVLNIATRGNTSAATVPTALDEGIRDGRIQRGHRLLIPVFGAGTTAGAAMVEY